MVLVCNIHYFVQYLLNGDSLFFSFLLCLLIGILLWRRAVSFLAFIDKIDYLYQYGLMDIYLVPRIKVQYYHRIFYCSNCSSFSWLEWLQVGSCILFFFFLVFLLFLWAAPTAYGGSQARGPIGVVATGLCQSHSNAGSELRLQPTPQPTATPDP